MPGLPKESDMPLLKQRVLEEKSVDEEVMEEEQKGAKKPKSNSNTSSSSYSNLAPLPFPQRFQKKKLDTQFFKFLEIFKKIHINIPFVNALDQMPNYAKFMKEVMSRKRKMADYETINLTEECNTIIQRKFP